MNREGRYEIHTNAFWNLQTYLGLRETLAANEGARGFLYDSRRGRTPLGHVHRSHIRDLTIESIRDVYHKNDSSRAPHQELKIPVDVEALVDHY